MSPEPAIWPKSLIAAADASCQPELAGRSELRSVMTPPEYKNGFHCEMWDEL
jgi:hypothetical protein